MAPIVESMMRCTGVRLFLAKEIIMKALAAIRRFIRDERGVTAIEYGLIASLIALAVSLAMGEVRAALESVFGEVVTALTPP
jgi:pilus assembly protein Flp/PilA